MHKDLIFHIICGVSLLLTLLLKARLKLYKGVLCPFYFGITWSLAVFFSKYV